MRLKLLVLTLTIISVLAVASSAGAGWSNYFGPATMTQSTPTPWTGFNYWSNNRVYRPLGHPFQLGYQYGSNFHISAENTGSNPFYWPSYGYNQSFCMWDYWHDITPTVSPVTCQAFV
jgi:hypothetical protein